MHIDEAIRLKKLKGDEVLQVDPAKLLEADRLSLEALKRLNDSRKLGNYSFNYPLQGETKEGE